MTQPSQAKVYRIVVGSLAEPPHQVDFVVNTTAFGVKPGQTMYRTQDFTQLRQIVRLAHTAGVTHADVWLPEYPSPADLLFVVLLVTNSTLQVRVYSRQGGAEIELPLYTLIHGTRTPLIQDGCLYRLYTSDGRERLCEGESIDVLLRFVYAYHDDSAVFQWLKVPADKGSMSTMGRGYIVPGEKHGPRIVVLSEGEY